MDISFEKWMLAVDKEVYAAAGVSYRDLPDICFRDLYDDETTAKEAALAVLEEAGFPFANEETEE